MMQFHEFFSSMKTLFPSFSSSL